MKKTLSLSLGGRVFAVEEDAYARLSAYLTALKDRFRGEPAVDELMQDIEASLAEKCAQRIQPYKEALTLADVEEVIAVLGDVDEIADEERSEAEPAPEAEGPSAPKRLYRDAEDVAVAGVSAGLAAYLDVDPLYVRLGFIVLTLLNGIGFVLYGILWLVVPRAVTPVQKLEMRGRPTSVNALQERLREKASELSQEGKSAWKRLEAPTSPLRRLLSLPVRLVAMVFGFCKRIVLAIGPILRVLVGAALALFATLGIAGVTMLAALLAFRARSPYLVSDVPLAELSQNPSYYVGIGTFFLLCAVPLFFVALLGATIIRRKSAFRTAVVASLAALWIVAAATGAVVAAELIPWAQERAQQRQTQELTTRTYTPGMVEGLVASGRIRLSVVQGEVPSLVLRGRASDLEALTTEEANGVLAIDQRPHVSRFCIFCEARPIEGVLTLPVLNAVQAGDRTQVTVRGFAGDIRLTVKDVARLEMELRGQSATATVSDVARLSLTGSSARLAVEAQDASRTEADVNVSGTVTVRQKDVARVTLNGTAAELRASLQDATRLEAAGLAADLVAVSATDVGRAEVSPRRDFMATSTDASRILHGDLAPTAAHRDDQGRIERREAE